MSKQIAALRTALINSLKGLAIGMANAIPGVSGGTIAVITGIYARTLSAIGGFFTDYGGWKANLGFLAPIVLGGAVGIGLFAQIIDRLLVAAPEQTFFFFIGLILGSLPHLVGKALEPSRATGATGKTRAPGETGAPADDAAEQRTGNPRFSPIYVLPFTLTLGILIVIELLGSPSESPPITNLDLAGGLLIFLSGMISAAAMIIPGISGSFILLLIGTYTTFIQAARDLNVPILLVFVVGAAAGLASVAKLIAWLLARFPRPTYWAIIGLVVGSVVSIWPGFTLGLEAVWSVAAAALGAVPALLLGSDRKERGRSPEAGG